MISKCWGRRKGRDLQDCNALSEKSVIEQPHLDQKLTGCTRVGHPQCQPKVDGVVATKRTAKGSLNP